MFQGAMSASLIGLPKCGLSCALAAAAMPASTPAARMTLRRDDIAHLPFFGDRPALYPVVMLHERVRVDAAMGADLLDRRLDVTVAVERAALQYRQPAVPVPRRLEGRQAFVQYRRLQRRFTPVLAAVDRDVDLLDLAPAGPRKTTDFVGPRAGQLLSARWRGDDRLGVHFHAELAPLAVGHRVRVARGFAAEMPRLIADLDAAQPLDVDVAFPTREKRAQRIAVFRSQHFAVQRIHDEAVAHRFLERNT